MVWTLYNALLTPNNKKFVRDINNLTEKCKQEFCEESNKKNIFIIGP